MLQSAAQYWRAFLAAVFEFLDPFNSEKLRSRQLPASVPSQPTRTWTAGSTNENVCLGDCVKKYGQVVAGYNLKCVSTLITPELIVD